MGIPQIHHETSEHLEAMAFYVKFGFAESVDVMLETFTPERTKKFLEGWLGHWNFKKDQDKIKLFLSQLEAKL